MPFEQPNFERHYSVNEDEIRAEGKRKGWSDTEIDAKILSEKAKMESANNRVADEVEEDASEKALRSVSNAFEEKYENDPEFRKKMDERESEAA